MKKLLLPVILFLLSFAVNAQVIDNFDSTATDPTYQSSIENADSSYLILSQNTTDKMEGEASLEMKARIGALHQWGSFAQLIKRVPDNGYLDWSISDSLRIWIKVTTPPTIPANVVFRIHIADRLVPDGDVEEYIYENATVLDESKGWVHLAVPLVERETDGATIPNEDGFVIAPSGWGGFTYNDRKLNFDKIIGYNISFITTGWDASNNLPADSIVFLVDNFERTGVKATPAVFFNGMKLVAESIIWSWGQSSLAVEEGAGILPNTNAFKWIQGNEYGNGWTGVGVTYPAPFNIAGGWPTDSIKFKMKTDEGVGAVRVQLESGPDGARKPKGLVFQPNTDGQWHEYALPLRDFVVQDNKPGFDSSDVQVLGFIAEASGIAGKVLYITDVWTGNPVFDVVPPVPVTNVGVVAGSFQNLVSWMDVPGETEETYTVYYSKNPITDLDAAEVAVLTIREEEKLGTHLLRAPVSNQDVTYYYAVTCTDKAGNTSQAAVYNTPTTNTAKGVPTISLTVPGTFTADGNLDEWGAITPFVMKESDGSAFEVQNQEIDNDEDLSAKAYVAVDNDYLYVAFAVTDNVVSSDSGTASYLNDAPDMFFGLFNWHGRPHTGYKRGLTPDYQVRFAQHKMILEGHGDLMFPGENYAWEPQFPSGYNVEARIPLSRLAEMGEDNLFVPVEGYRIPIDFSFNDRDELAEREGILTYSPFNEDKSYQDPSRWLYTWIGTLWEPVTDVNDETAPVEYALSQNYPNPFNPETKIVYSLKNEGNVSLKIFDVLGREVVTLINQHQTAGTHSVSFNAMNLSSGIYFYKLESGSFSSIKKMMLLK